MIKKIFLILCIVFMLSSCSSKEKVCYPYEIKYKEVDMSGYEDINSTEHMFKGVTVQELFNVIDNKSSGVFYLGRTNCGCCQTCAKYINEAATQENVTVYYIDVYDKVMPIDTEELMDKLKMYIYEALNEVDGEKTLQTPIVFSVINGKISDSIVCLSDNSWDDEPTKIQENRLLKKYKSIMKPFAK